MGKKINILDVFLDEKLSDLEKVNFIRKQDLIEFCGNASFDHLTTLLAIFNKLDNYELESWIEKMLSLIDFKPFFEKLLMFLEVNGRDFQRIPQLIWTSIYNQNLKLFV